MNAERSAHIEEQRLLEVLAEDVQMTGAENEHLAQCLQCRSAHDHLRTDLQTLHRASRHFTPERTRRITLPASAAPTRASGLPRGWHIATGAVATLCLAVVLWWPDGPLGPGTAPIEIGQRAVAVKPDPVMLETRMLAENALPVAYQAIVESLDDSFDEGFIDFVIPALDEKSLS
jgi:hypothetical protein